MVAAAIRAGEEAANDDFKVKYEQVAAELADVRAELEAAADAQKEAETKGLRGRRPRDPPAGRLGRTSVAVRRRNAWPSRPARPRNS